MNLGGPVAELLTGQLGMDSLFVEDRVRTVFLNGRPVDDLAVAVVEQAAQIGLGGAVPGIVGIAMRRRSPAALFRQDITYSSPRKATKRQKGWITLKLFNEIAEAFGPVVLARGFEIDTTCLNNSLADSQATVRAEIDGKTVTLEALRSTLLQRADNDRPSVFLRVYEAGSDR